MNQPTTYYVHFHEICKQRLIPKLENTFPEIILKSDFDSFLKDLIEKLEKFDSMNDFRMWEEKDKIIEDLKK